MLCARLYHLLRLGMPAVISRGLMLPKFSSMAKCSAMVIGCHSQS